MRIFMVSDIEGLTGVYHWAQTKPGNPAYAEAQELLMGDLLEEFFKRPYVAAKVAEGKLPDTWRAVVGDRAADFTTELKLENHILYARIQSSVLRSELFYQREALKEEINRRSGVRLVNAVIIR